MVGPTLPPTRAFGAIRFLLYKLTTADLLRNIFYILGKRGKRVAQKVEPFFFFVLLFLAGIIYSLVELPMRRLS